MKCLPELLNVEATDLDPVTVLKQEPVRGLLIVGMDDKVTPASDVQQLKDVLAPGSEMVLILRATHETVAYQFESVAPMVEKWIRSECSD